MKVIGDYVGMRLPNIENMEHVEKQEKIPYRKKKQIYWRNIPKSSVVYFLSDGDEVYYIGETSNLYLRVNGHEKIDDRVTKIYFLRVVNPNERKLLEKAYIMAMTPDRNKDTYK